MKDTELKRAFYSSNHVVEIYDDFRFKNKGGLHVHHEEVRVARMFWERIDNKVNVLDMPVGTGRFASHLGDSGFSRIIGADYSLSMLLFCKERVKALSQLCRQDAFKTGFANKSFGLVISMRFFFHYQDTLTLLHEFRRILNDDGYLILDTTTWSPRTWTNMFNKKLGGEIYTHSQSEFEMLAEKAGFNVIDKQEILMLPSFIYNFIPNFLIPLISLLDKIYPKFLKAKRVWLLKVKQ